ncbi:MAG: MarR family transcriptional regulator [Thermomicrobiales bacterium]
MIEDREAVLNDRATEAAEGMLDLLGRLRRLRVESMARTGENVFASTGEGRGPREWHGQVRMMRILQDHGPMTMRDLAAHMDVTPPTVTALTKRLREQELIERVQDDTDSRVFWIGISPRGREAITAFHAARVEGIRQLIARFDEDDQAEILRAVHILGRVLIDQRAPLDDDEHPDAHIVTSASSTRA